MSRPIDIAAVERYARQLRAEEMQRLEGMLVTRVRLYASLLVGTLLSLAGWFGELLRPMFSWNPQARRST